VGYTCRMPPNTVVTSPAPVAPRRNRILVTLGLPFLVFIAFAIGYAVNGMYAGDQVAPPTPLPERIETSIYYSPTSKSIVAYGPGDATRTFNFEVSSEPREPIASDIPLVRVPYQIAGIGNATTTATGEMAFVVEAVSEPIVHYSEGVPASVGDSSTLTLAFYYDPATNFLRKVTNVPSGIDRPKLLEVAPDGIRMRFSDSCWGCGPHGLGSDQFVWTLSGDSKYLENPVQEFEWLEGGKYRYKEYVFVETGGECREVVGGDVCYIPAAEVPWKEGELRMN